METWITIIALACGIPMVLMVWALCIDVLRRFWKEWHS